jgi:uracil-DNA glycosylase family 4
MNNKNTVLKQVPSYDCPLCPRLVAFRAANRIAYPSFFNGPVPSFGELDAELLVVGLAPGLKGANQTGRPFTGDYAGIILYSSLEKSGFAKGNYDPTKVSKGKGDGFQLVNARVTNAVRCVPQENKPEPLEIKQCNGFLVPEIAAMPNLKIIISLGLIAHKAVIMAQGLKQSAYKFGHGTIHNLPEITLLNSYHCSRYNINTGVLTQEMFDKIVEKAKSLIKG